MGIFDVGRVCVKIAGRDARKKCVVVEVIDNNFVLIDGETRRRKCNVAHLEPLNLVIDIKSGAENTEVVKALETEGIVCQLKKESKKEPKPRPKKEKVVKKKPAEAGTEKKEEKVEKKTEKEAKPKKAKKAAEKKE